MRLIDADELGAAYYGLYRHGLMAVKAVLPCFVNLLNEQPTIDPVHAEGGCYCRECKSFDKDDEGLCICKHDGGLRWPHDNNFCKYGRRREKTCETD